MGLAINPEGEVSGPKLSEMVANGEIKQKSENEDTDKMGILCFKIDTTYTRTIPGFLRLVQLLLLIVGAICLVFATWVKPGIYAVYCILLVAAAISGSYLLITRLTGGRSNDCCGFSWIFLEFLYYAIFGFLIFVGACLAAGNNPNGSSGVSGAAAFGFFATFIYIYLIWHGWKAYKEVDAEKDEKKSNKSDESERKEEEVEETKIEIEKDFLEEPPVKKLGIPVKNHSLPADLSHLYENTMSQYTSNRRPSYSDKDSAFSEGEENVKDHIRDSMRHKSQYHSHRRKKHKSATIEGVLSRQPLAHISHRQRAEAFDVNSLGRSTIGYPSVVSASLPNRSDDKFYDSHKKKRKNKPDWLRAAESRDGMMDGCSDMFVGDNEIIRRFSAAASVKRREYPLLNDSAEESICYPSISQQQRTHRKELVPNPLRRSLRRPIKHHKHRTRISTYQHSHKEHRRHHGGHHHRHHSHGRLYGNHSHHHHHGHRRHGGSRRHRKSSGRVKSQRMLYGGRKPVDADHEDYIRQMVGRDELVNMSKPGTEPRSLDNQQMRGNEKSRHRHSLEETLHKTPVPNGMDNPVMQKYFLNMK